MALNDLQGLMFGQLVALRYKGRSLWDWQCDCGKVITANGSNVKSGHGA